MWTKTCLRHVSKYKTVESATYLDILECERARDLNIPVLAIWILNLGLASRRLTRQVEEAVGTAEHFPALRGLRHDAASWAVPMSDEWSVGLEDGRPGFVETRERGAVGLVVGVVVGMPLRSLVELTAVKEVDGVCPTTLALSSQDGRRWESMRCGTLTFFHEFHGWMLTRTFVPVATNDEQRLCCTRHDEIVHLV